MKKKLLFVFNPKSGKGLIKEHLVNIVDIMTKAGYKITIYPTQCQGDAIKKVRKNAEKYDLVVCSGGDGTLDEVVTGMEQSEVNVPIGYIPAGSTNDFANSLGIPKNMEEAARVAVTVLHSRVMWEVSTEIPSYMLQPLDFLQRYPTRPRSR